MSDRGSRAWARAGLVILAIGAAAPAVAQEPLEDGLYRITRSGTRRAQVVPVFETERLLIHDGRYLEPDPTRENELVVVGVSPDARLTLAAEPETIQDEHGRAGVRARLGPRTLASLEELARKHPSAGIALVLDGEVVVTRRLKETRDTGVIDVVGCPDAVCGLLQQHLRGRVEPASRPAVQGGE